MKMHPAGSFAIAALVLSAGVAGAAQPVAYWRFDDGSGAVARDETGIHHGTVVNYDEAVWDEGKHGGGMLIWPDAYTNFVRVNDHADLQLSAYTITGWFRTNYKSTRTTLIMKDQNSPRRRNYWISVETSGLLCFRTSVSGSTTGKELFSSVTVDNGEWRHFAAVIDGSAGRLYIDGVLSGSHATLGPADTGDGDVFIGIQTDLSANSRVRGRIDDFRIYDVALTQSQVQATMAAPPASFSLTGPADGAAVSSLRPSFTWQASTGASSYELVVSENANMSSPALSRTGITGTSFVPPGNLDAGTQYYWRVYARSSTVLKQCTADFRFTTPQGPGAFSLFAPIDGAVDVPVMPEFSWTPSDRADYYELEISEDASFASATKRIVYGTAHTPGARLPYDTEIWWRVRAFSPISGLDASNNDFSFTTEEDVYPPELLSSDPPDGTLSAKTNAKPRLRFDEPLNLDTVLAGGAVTMTYYGGPVPGIVSLADGGSSILFTPSEPLLHLTTYTVTVRGTIEDLEGNKKGSGHSYIVTFTTGKPSAGCAAGAGPLAAVFLAAALALAQVGRRGF